MKLLLIIPLFMTIACVKESDKEKWFRWVRDRAECQASTKMSDISLAKTILGIRVDDPKTKEFAECVFKRFNYMNGKGELQIGIIIETVDGYFAHKQDVFLQKCLIERGTPGETAYEYILCFRNLEKTIGKNYGDNALNIASL